MYVYYFDRVRFLGQRSSEKQNACQVICPYWIKPYQWTQCSQAFPQITLSALPLFTYSSFYFTFVSPHNYSSIKVAMQNHFNHVL